MQRFGPQERQCVPLVSVPGYMEWSERRLEAGESPILMASLDGQTVEVGSDGGMELDESYFDGILESLRDQDW